MNSLIRRVCVWAFFTCLSVGTLPGQDNNSAAVSGTVIHLGGQPAAHVNIQALHIPSGRLSASVTNRAGKFFLRGLEVGGPYKIEVRSSQSLLAATGEFFLGLGETLELELTAATDAGAAAPTEGPVHRLTPYVVTAAREGSAAGAGRHLDEEAIELQSSINQSLIDYARADPRLVMLDPDFEELTAAGQNSRYNAILVDGVNMHDLYGVSANGLPSQGNPFSMETVAAVAVDLSPYDAERGGFTGAAIQAVTKSGTNAFSGSLYARYRNEKFRARHPITGERDPFDDLTYGITLGGPVRRDAAFFFVAYEQAERTEPAPAAGFSPDPAALDRLISAARGHGHEPGALTSPGQPKKSDQKYLGQIDWQLSSAHRLSIRYSETRGQQPVFSNYSSSGRVSLSGHWYVNVQNLQAWAAQLRSRWAGGWQTELKVARQDYQSQRLPRTRFPQVRVNAVPAEGGGPTGSVFLGGDDSSQLNEKEVGYTQLGGVAVRLFGKHRVTRGAQWERTDFSDQFRQNAWGNYTFSNIDNFALGRTSAYTYQYVLPGRSAGADWSLDVWAAHLQDVWSVTPRLQLSAGLRAEMTATGDRPVENPLVEATFGIRNTETVDGAFSVGPRASFTYKLDAVGRTRVRGGAGVFQGRAPGVWLTNGYVNTGLATGLNTRVPQVNGQPAFSPDPDAQFPGTPETRRQLVDLTAPDFRLPTIARGNLAIDHRLPWQKFLLSFELLHTETLRGITYENLNLKRTGAGPDGRPLYGDRTASGSLRSNSYFRSDAFADVFLLKNTSGGQATQWTLALRRPLTGRWAASASYTRSHAQDVSPITASTAATNWATRVAADPNDSAVGTSNTEIRHRVLASITYKLNFFARAESLVSLQYEGRSGRPYSFVFSNDINGDSASYDNDLYYVPAGPTDPRVRFRTPAQAEAFFAYLAATPALARFAGQIVPRNSERAPFVHRVDLKFVQKIQLARNTLAEIFADVFNLGNLLNDRWGRVEQAGFPYALSVGSAVFEPSSGQYVYTFSSPASLRLQPSLSRWQVQGGVRLKF